MIFKRPLLIECNQCGEIIEASTILNIIDYNERSMGPEITYNGDITEVCPVCGGIINIVFNVWEYPIGAIDYHEENCVGAVIIEEPEYDPFMFDE